MFCQALVILILILLIYTIFKIIDTNYDNFSIENNKKVESTIDGKQYYVHGGHEDMQNASNMFAELNKTTTDVIEYIHNKYKNSENPRRKEVANLLIKRYDESHLRESSPLNSKRDTSFTINKGDIIAVCIRSGQINNQIHDKNTVLFVVLHEITHIAITAYDHPDEFWEVFKFILLEAEEAKLYISPNYALDPREYCGIKINYNPRYDVTISEI